jgi:hypothetical protein
VFPLPESQANIWVCSTVARPNRSAVDLHQTDLFILIGIAIHEDLRALWFDGA